MAPRTAPARGASPGPRLNRDRGERLHRSAIPGVGGWVERRTMPAERLGAERGSESVARVGVRSGRARAAGTSLYEAGTREHWARRPMRPRCSDDGQTAPFSSATACKKRAARKLEACCGNAAAGAFAGVHSGCNHRNRAHSSWFCSSCRRGLCECALPAALIAGSAGRTASSSPGCSLRLGRHSSSSRWCAPASLEPPRYRSRAITL